MPLESEGQSAYEDLDIESRDQLDNHSGPPMAESGHVPEVAVQRITCMSRCKAVALKVWRHPIVTNPLLASISGLILGCVEPIKNFLVTPNAPLNWLFEGIATVGRAATPLAMIIMGAQLQASTVNSREAASQLRSRHN
eukprot:scaffold302742_cov50-Prasinocladus_malaysianus.AAC.1